jgi:O-antigen/teichoic acid export membrane protein
MTIKRAFLFSFVERYSVTAINLAVTIAVSRILTPEQYGISVIGSAGLAIADVVRDLGTGSYLVQQKQLTIGKIRTAFTVTLVSALAITAILLALSQAISEYYAVSGLTTYVQVGLAPMLLGPFISTVAGLLRRDMCFGKLAVASIAASLVNAGAAVLLSLMGVGFMSFAWANALSAAVSLLVLLSYRPERSIFIPSLREWRDVLSFGVYATSTSGLSILWEQVPYLIFGRILGGEAVGLYQRAYLLSRQPDRVLLAGVGAVALPALALHVREGKKLSASYLQAVEYITVVRWPALVVLSIVAYPYVLILLGSQWLSIVPLVQIMAIAQLSAFTASLDYPVLLAVGAVRHALLLTVVQLGISLPIMLCVAPYGLEAVALSSLFTVSCNIGLSVCLVRYHIRFRWRDLIAATRKSAVVTALSGVGPLAVFLGSWPHPGISVAWTIVALGLAALGWVGGLWFSDHPLLREVIRRGMPAVEIGDKKIAT